MQNGFIRSTRRFSSVRSHNRDIGVLFNKNQVFYTIPIYSDKEREALGFVLELQIDLSDTNKAITLQKKKKLLGCCGEKLDLVKTIFTQLI
jgi:hypothetical protein